MPENANQDLKTVAEVSPDRFSIPDRPDYYEVTPEFAAWLLEMNIGNRPPRDASYKAMVRDMLGGRWHKTGQSLVISTTGRLLNGQKQLMAVVESGTTQTFLIAPGIEDEAQRVMDTGDPRTMAQTLAMQGRSYPQVLGSVARLVALWDRNRLSINSHLSPEEVLYVIERDTDLPSAIAYAAQIKKLRLRQPSIAFCVWMLRRKHHGADSFFQDLRQKRTTGYGDPKAALLELLEKWDDEEYKPKPAQEIAAVFTAWNHVMAREALVDRIRLKTKPDPVNARRVVWVIPEPLGESKP